MGEKEHARTKRELKWPDKGKIPFDLPANIFSILLIILVAHKNPRKKKINANRCHEAPFTCSPVRINRLAINLLPFQNFLSYLQPENIHSNYTNPNTGGVGT
jgi:hypothetical protein